MARGAGLQEDFAALCERSGCCSVLELGRAGVPSAAPGSQAGVLGGHAWPYADRMLGQCRSGLLRAGFLRKARGLRGRTAAALLGAAAAGSCHFSGGAPCRPRVCPGRVAAPPLSAFACVLLVRVAGRCCASGPWEGSAAAAPRNPRRLGAATCLLRPAPRAWPRYAPRAECARGLRPCYLWPWPGGVAPPQRCAAMLCGGPRGVARPRLRALRCCPCRPMCSGPARVRGRAAGGPLRPAPSRASPARLANVPSRLAVPHGERRRRSSLRVLPPGLARGL